DRWFISFKMDFEPVNTSTYLDSARYKSLSVDPERSRRVNRPKPYPVVGVDLGIKALAVLSTGKDSQ
ncbi:MAG: hypothetical protein ACLFVV_26740, partial [Coleofasciculus sp.]